MPSNLSKTVEQKIRQAKKSPIRDRYVRQTKNEKRKEPTSGREYNLPFTD